MFLEEVIRVMISYEVQDKERTCENCLIKCVCKQGQ